MIYCFDLDGTICGEVENSQYRFAEPNLVVVDEINRLYNLGNKIIIMTARGSVSRIDYTEITKQQLKVWEVNYHELLMNIKPNADIYIDDKAMDIKDWLLQIPQIRGIIAGAFDLIHPGYIKMFEEAKRNCTHLTIALHENPSFENHKLVPVHTIEERRKIISSMKYVDSVIIYKAEKDLKEILNSGNYDVRFLGDDYKQKNYTAKELLLKIHWINRNHGYSTTNLKKKIAQSLGEIND